LVGRLRPYRGQREMCRSGTRLCGHILDGTHRALVAWLGTFADLLLIERVTSILIKEPAECSVSWPRLIGLRRSTALAPSVEMGIEHAGTVNGFGVVWPQSRSVERKACGNVSIGRVPIVRDATPLERLLEHVARPIHGSPHNTSAALVMRALPASRSI